MNSLIQPASIALVRRHFSQANQEFDAYAAVFETIGDRLQERLSLLAIKPARVLDLGCRSGYQLAALQQRYPDAQIIGADPAPGMVPQLPGSWPRWLRRRSRAPHRVACDPHELPFADGSFDLVVSNMLLPWCHAPHRVFEEAARILSPGGAFMFTSAGPDTLMEYRSAWAAIDSYLHGFGLIDMHDLGDTLMASGFAAPVLDRDNLQIDYPSIDALQNELQQLGAANVASGRRFGLMSPSVRKALSSVAAGQRFPVTLELVQGHGWKGELAKTGRQPEDEYRVSVDSLRGSWQRSTSDRQT
ncbi:methyltransferase domain-containing protein [Granulosicoccus antarcticus]|uniref:Malonyl-[acyl-carrier protein] O-methyltransferase n=1 Tax=Granulosicoccus antarcticus IMCC3135 TaxID=1192854 RepID=A0A2Z2NII0_9GAMM|nr:methyltransferase domain-containing protein [Granulosicoccus antarcticus]ASJ71146.1 Malonyl-[acyl-carrier protein] O-methyltransferase [Granulosicoccus antarcticus IMCC3135]